MRKYRLIAALLLLVIAWQWGSAGWIVVKAQLAQWLIARAWSETLAQPAQIYKPWPWADTWPVARLQMPERGIDLYILAGVQGNSLAFGPGHQQGTALPGEGMSVIGGHRDTHFRFLSEVAPGDQLVVERATGRTIRYRITALDVVDITRQPLQIAPDEQGLLLITCYPFVALRNGPLRLLVWAEAESGAQTRSTYLTPSPDTIT
jgi:sortase A